MTETYIFARQEVHGPLNVLDSNTAADMRLCRLDPHFSKQVHHTWATVKLNYQDVLHKSEQDVWIMELNDSIHYIFTPGVNMSYLVGCRDLQRHPTNRSGKPAPRLPPPPAGVG